MRRVNAVLSVAILALFALHGVLGAYQLTGAGGAASAAITHTLLTLIAVHAVFGVILTCRTLIVGHRTGAHYFKENRLFWARRISGFAVLLLLAFHVGGLSYIVDGAFRLKQIGALELTLQLLLVASLALHIISNVRPALISFGIRALKPRAVDIIFILAVILLVMAGGFVFYYIRWNWL